MSVYILFQLSISVILIMAGLLIIKINYPLTPIRRWILEIKKVGFKNWYWFVVILKRDEFHKSLSQITSNRIEVVKKRKLAHYIDNELERLWYSKPLYSERNQE